MDVVDPLIPLWLKVAGTVFVAVLIPVYAVKYGPENFLWFSDVALFGTVAALWLESSLVASTMALAVLVPEFFWNVSFFGRLLTGKSISDLTDYMFDREKPLCLRGLSLFHVFLPVLLVWLVARLGYHPGAFVAQTILMLLILPLSYWLTDPERNVNWVHSTARVEWLRMPPGVFLALLMVALPLVVYLPTHLMLDALFG